jgi:flagellar basal-body rod modification protein FlgD
MTTVSDPLNSLASPATTAAVTKAASNTTLDQKSFLQLMIAQFKNQDPTKPQDPTAFLGQLAQFSTVSGIQDMQTSLSTLSDSLRSQSVLSGASLVGRDVLTPASTIGMAANEGVYGALDVPDGATSVDMVIKDNAGQTIRHYSMPASAGMSNFAWDGATDNGGAAPTGIYSVSATTNIGGKSQSVPVLLDSQVTSVTIDPQSNNLVLNTRGLGSVPLSGVRRVM